MLADVYHHLRVLHADVCVHIVLVHVGDVTAVGWATVHHSLEKKVGLD